MLKRLLIIFFLGIIVRGMAQDKIRWSDNQKLSWSDFQSGTKPNTNNAAATTFCGISYLLNSPTEKFTSQQVRVEAFFVPSRSWARPDHKTDFVLLHEQSHFDIAELFARKFRQLISDKKMDAKALQKYYSKIYEAYKQYQQDYESVTNHGRIRDKQYEYSQKITSEIEELSDFKI